MSLRSILTAWRNKANGLILGAWASGQIGRVGKLRKFDRTRDALEVGKRALARVRASDVPSEEVSYTIVVLTIQVEQLARELGEPSADRKDLEITLNSLREPPVRRVSARFDAQLAAVRREWIPYLETRLAELRTE